MKLYNARTSGNGYKVRLLLSLLGVPYEQVLIDYDGREHKQQPYLKINPRGQVPGLEDNGVVLWDSMACLVYVARKYGGDQWLPADAAQMAQVMQWMALSANEIQYGIQYARGILKKIRSGDFADYQQRGKLALDVLEGQLRDHDWLALGRPTIADIACQAYVAIADEAQLPLDDYPAIRAWLKRIEALPGWISRVQ